MTVLPISSAKKPFDLATEILWQHRWECRAEAMRLVITTLVNDHGCSEATAEVAAIQAYADLDSVNTDASIDMQASNAKVVVIRTGKGCPVVLTARDLDRLLRQARDADMLQVVDADTRRPVVFEH